MKLKVLPNRYQGIFFNGVGRKGIDKVLCLIFGTYEVVEPVYNRIGYYCNKTSAWYEFKLPSGEFIGVRDSDKAEYTIITFQTDMEFKNSVENPIRDCDWEMISKLITNKVLKLSKKYDLEMFRREQHTSSRESRKKGVKARKDFLLKVKMIKAKNVQK